MHCSHKGTAEGQQQYSGRLWCLNNAQLVLRGPKCAKKSFPVAQLVEHGASNAKIMGSIPRESKS